MIYGLLMVGGTCALNGTSMAQVDIVTMHSVQTDP